MSCKWNHTLCNFLGLSSFNQHNAFHNWVFIAFFFLRFPAVKKILYSKILWFHRKIVTSHINVENLYYSRNNTSTYSCLCCFKCDTMSFTFQMHSVWCLELNCHLVFALLHKMLIHIFFSGWHFLCFYSFKSYFKEWYSLAVFVNHVFGRNP